MRLGPKKHWMSIPNSHFPWQRPERGLDAAFANILWPLVESYVLASGQSAVAAAFLDRPTQADTGRSGRKLADR